MTSRREFLRLAALAGAGAALGGAACASGNGRSDAGQKPTTSPGGGERTLRIIQWTHFVPAYDAWFDNEYTRRWGEEHDVKVVVDHIVQEQLPERAQAEVAAQRGHDLFFNATAGGPALEDEVIDHREIVEEVEAKVGKMAPLVERTVLNPKTGKYFGFSDFWAPGPVNYRTDLWDPTGVKPDSWDSILMASSDVKAKGGPIGLGIASNFDAQSTLLSLLHSYGASIQDEESNVVINRAATIEAVKFMTALYRQGMTEDVLTWDSTSNNRSLAEGRSSLVVNAISSLRAVEAQDPDLAGRIGLLPTPEGPEGRHAVHVYGTYAIFRFARHQELAKQFLVDLVLDYRQAFEKSAMYNMPSFPGGLPDLGRIVAGEPKYGLLADAAAWSTNMGHPGSTSAAIDEVFNRFVIAEMFAPAAKGEATAEEAVATAEARIKPIFEKWRELGKV